MARYDDPESQGVGSAEFHGLSGADLLGLSPSSHASMAMWRLQYSPQMWLGATTGQFDWRGSMLVGGRIPKSFLQGLSGQIGDKYGGRFVKKGLNVVGNFIGGWKGDIVDPMAQRVMREGSYNVFSRGGSAAFRTSYEEEMFQEMRRGLGWKDRAGHPGKYGKWEVRPSKGVKGRYQTLGGKQLKQMESEAGRLAGGKASSALWRLRALKIMGGANVVLTTAMLADLAANVAYGAVTGANALAQKLSTNNLLDMTPGANVVGAYGASTERQRALQAIQANNLNARRFIGSEAAMMHQ